MKVDIFLLCVKMLVNTQSIACAFALIRQKIYSSQILRPITDEFMDDCGLFRRARAVALARKKKLQAPKRRSFWRVQVIVVWLIQKKNRLLGFPKGLLRIQSYLKTAFIIKTKKRLKEIAAAID